MWDSVLILWRVDDSQENSAKIKVFAYLSVDAKIMVPILDVANATVDKGKQCISQHNQILTLLKRNQLFRNTTENVISLVNVN